MAQIDRMMGSLLVFTVGSLDCKDTAKEASVEFYADVAENMAIRDFWHYPHVVTRGVRISATFAAEKDSRTAGLMNTGNQLSIVFESGADQANKKIKVTGNFLVTRSTFREAKEGCDVQVELESRGEVTITSGGS